MLSPANYKNWTSYWDLKSDVSELKQSVEYNNALMEELKKEQKSLREDNANLKKKTPWRLKMQNSN